MTVEETATAAVDALLDDLDQFGGKLGLEAITRLLDAFGDPQDDVPSVVVAGTNGKGSTCALLAACGHAAGYRTGLYTSPHLERPEERIRVDGRVIESARLADLLTEVVARNQELFGVRPSYFEAMTAAARLHFARSGCELAVIEVGLGGRLDATNVGQPVLTVVTPVSFDHEAQLGPTLERIAAEKAGIFRPHVPAVAWCQPEAVGETLRHAAERLEAPLLAAERRVRVRALDAVTTLPARLEVETEAHRYRLEVGLLGSHQHPNVALAVLAAETLRERGFPALGPAAIEAGARRCRWPGRMEEIELPGGRRVLLDGAHNPAGAEVLAALLDQLEGPTDLLFGSLATKDVRRILPLLAQRCRFVGLTAPHGGTPHEPARLAELLEGTVPAERVLVERDLEAALDRQLERRPPPRRLLVAGSLYLVGDVRGLLSERYGVPEPAVRVETG